MFLPDKLKHLLDEVRCAGPKPFTLEHFAEWLEKFPADRAYDWFDFRGGCLLGQYATAHDSGCYVDALGNNAASYEDLAFDKPNTFGGALERARAAISLGGPPQGDTSPC